MVPPPPPPPSRRRAEFAEEHLCAAVDTCKRADGARCVQGRRANQKWDVAVSVFWWEEVRGGFPLSSLAGPIRGEAASGMRERGGGAGGRFGPPFKNRGERKTRC